jgi:hypothetical protein
MNFRHPRNAAAAARSVDSIQFVLKSLRRRWANSLDRGPDIEISALPAGASVTKGNPFLPLTISILRLFGNEDRHSTRLPNLHMVTLSAV